MALLPVAVGFFPGLVHDQAEIEQQGLLPKSWFGDTVEMFRVEADAERWAKAMTQDASGEQAAYVWQVDLTDLDARSNDEINARNGPDIELDEGVDVPVDRLTRRARITLR